MLHIYSIVTNSHVDDILKRYITPLIAPPTPPQLEQDKENIDEQFSRAFTLIEQLSTDTASLKSAEETRTERLDAALREVETVIADLKSSSRRKEDETRRISDEVKSLKDSIPKALEGAREGNENRLRELGTELKSLKVLLGNRLGGSGGPSSPGPGRTPGSTPLPTGSRPVEEPSTAPSAEQESAATPAAGQATSSPGTGTPTTNPLSQLGRSASIPAWQMAAANRSKSASQSSPNSTGGENTSNSTNEQQQSAPAS